MLSPTPKQLERELANLKTWDEVQFSKTIHNEFQFISTDGHGYLAIPSTHPEYQKAKEICEYGFHGDLAVYLDEDSEMWKFIDAIKKI